MSLTRAARRPIARAGLRAHTVGLFIRALMVATGLANYIPYQLAVCCSAGVIAVLALWHFGAHEALR